MDFKTDCLDLRNMDCMELLKNTPDKFYSLCIVDPPYGLGQKIVSGGLRGSKFEAGTNVDWDNVPTQEYFDELFRVSQNQIIWGGNYFCLPPTRCNLMWDKIQEFTGADFELAWTSFDLPNKAFRMSRVEAYSKGKIHICQKPIKLYEWLFKNYAKPNDKILDTHLGSASIAIAINNMNKMDNMNLHLTATELDHDYFKASVERVRNAIKQTTIFDTF